MRSADIKVGRFYALKNYADKDGVRCEVLTVGVHPYEHDAPGRYVRVRTSHLGVISRVAPARILREWTEADDERVTAREAATQLAKAEAGQLKRLVEECGLTDVAVLSPRHHLTLPRTVAIRVLEELAAARRAAQ